MSDRLENGISVVQVQDGKTKSQFTQKVLEKLPEWFGNQEALNNYAVESAECPYWAAMDKDDSCIGFFAVKIHYGHTGDIFVCGILPEYQHMGIGTELYKAAEQYLIQSGCKYVMVETLSDTVDFEPYARTRSFYRSVGFEPLITLTEMWDEENPCLIMIKTIK